MMHSHHNTLLIVDDYEPLRAALCELFSESGYQARSAEDGVSALQEIQREIPDILLSDLNVPGLSSFEFLSLVRRRFPAVRVIAMSGEFSGNDMPPGVAADAFFEKGTDLESLMRIMAAITWVDKGPVLEPPNVLAPIWIPRNGQDHAGELYAIVTCPECLRTFPQSLGESPDPIRAANCVYCSGVIRYAIVRTADDSFLQDFQRKAATGTAIPLGVPD
jgi:CheY-like chemotaxis protein